MKKPIPTFLLVSLLSVSASSDPLADFKTLVAKCQQSLDMQPATEIRPISPNGKWVKRLRQPSTVSFDVKRTDSLVSPLMGTIEIETTFYSGTADDQPSAIALQVIPNTGTGAEVSRSIRFFYREEKSLWEATESLNTFKLLRDGTAVNGNGDKFKVDKAGLIKGKEPTPECLNLS